MRKMFAAAVALFLAIGVTVAAEVTIVKVDAAAKTVTVKEGDAEKTLKLGEKVDATKLEKAVGKKVDANIKDDVFMGVKGKKKDKANK